MAHGPEFDTYELDSSYSILDPTVVQTISTPPVKLFRHTVAVVVSAFLVV